MLKVLTRRFAIFISCVVVITTIAAISIRARRLSQRWAYLESRLTSIENGLSHETRQTCLKMPCIEGDAMSAYALIDARLEGGFDPHMLEETVSDMSARGRDRASALVAQYSDVFPVLESAVRCGVLGGAYKRTSSGILNISRLSVLLRLKAKLDVGAGELLRASATLLDGCMYARDLISRGALLERSIYNTLFYDCITYLRDIIIHSSIRGVELKEIAQKLLSLDGLLTPDSRNLEAELLGVAENVTSVGGIAWESFPSYFTNRGMAIDALEEILRNVGRVGEVEFMQWRIANERLSVIGRAMAVARNPYVRLIDGQAWVFPLRRMLSAHLRILAMVCFLRGSVDAPALVDPFGEKIIVEKELGRIRVSSYGIEGAKSVGRGAWGKHARDGIVCEFSSALLNAK